MIPRLLCRFGFHSTVCYGGAVCIHCGGNTRPEDWDLSPAHPALHRRRLRWLAR